MIMSTAGVAKCGRSQACRLRNPAVSSLYNIEMLSSKAFTSTSLAISTSPIFQCLMFATVMDSFSGSCRGHIDGSGGGDAANQVGGFLGDHDDGRVGVTPDEARENRGIGDPESLDAMHP